jgi:hypothetical protein
VPLAGFRSVFSSQTTPTAALTSCVYLVPEVSIFPRKIPRNLPSGMLQIEIIKAVVPIVAKYEKK